MKINKNALLPLFLAYSVAQTVPSKEAAQMKAAYSEGMIAITPENIQVAIERINNIDASHEAKKFGIFSKKNNYLTKLKNRLNHPQDLSYKTALKHEAKSVYYNALASDDAATMTRATDTLKAIKEDYITEHLRQPRMGLFGLFGNKLDRYESNLKKEAKKLEIE